MNGISAGGLMLLVLAVASTFGAAAGVDLRMLEGERTRVGALLAAITANLLLLAPIAWLIARAAGLPEEVALGLVLAAAAPAGSTGPLLAQLAGGAAATGIALFTALAVVATAAIPLVLFSLGALRTGAGGAALALVGTVTAQLGPVVVGLWVRRRWPARAPAMARAASRVGLVLLVAVIVGYVAVHGALLLELGRTVAVAGGVVGLSLGLGRLGSGLTRDERVAVSQISAIRNLSLALLLVELLRLPEHAVLGVLAYGLPMYVIAGGAAAIQRRGSGQPARGQG